MTNTLEGFTEDGLPIRGKTDGTHWVLELDVDSNKTGVVLVVTLLSNEELNSYFDKVQVSGNSKEVMKMIQKEKKELIRYKITNLTVYLNYIRSISG